LDQRSSAKLAAKSFGFNLSPKTANQGLDQTQQTNHAHGATFLQPKMSVG
jgi:hypothetical protein